MLTEHISDEDVVEEIFAAINSLCTNSLDNRSHFHIAKAEGVMLKSIAKHEKVRYVYLFVLSLLVLLLVVVQFSCARFHIAQFYFCVDGTPLVTH